MPGDICYPNVTTEDWTMTEDAMSAADTASAADWMLAKEDYVEVLVDTIELEHASTVGTGEGTLLADPAVRIGFRGDWRSLSDLQTAMRAHAEPVAVVPRGTAWVVRETDA